MSKTIDSIGRVVSGVQMGNDAFDEIGSAVVQADVVRAPKESGGEAVQHAVPKAIQKKGVEQVVPNAIVPPVTQGDFIKMGYEFLQGLGDSDNTFNETEFNASMAKAEAIKREVVSPTIPSDERLAQQETSLLATLPEPCSVDLVGDACEKFSSTKRFPTVAEVADLLLVTVESVQAFYEVANLSTTATCQEICEAAYAMLPSEVKPPKSGVSGRRWRPGGRVYWDIDTSTNRLQSMEEEHEADGEPDLSEDSNKAPGHNNSGATIPDDGRSSLGLIGTAGEIAEAFGLHPHMDTTTGSLLQTGSAPYWETGRTGTCQGGLCLCYSRSAYGSNPKISGIWANVITWNYLFKMSRYNSNARHWAPKIFKVQYDDPQLVRHLEDLYNQVRDYDVHLCIDFLFNIVRTDAANYENIAGYTPRTQKFYFTAKGWESDLVFHVITWFHEVSHMYPLSRDDYGSRGYGVARVLQLGLPEALNNADSYEVYLGRVLGRSYHPSNR